MLWAALATYLMMVFGGGGLEFHLTNLKKPVKEHVQDKTCQKEIINESKALAKELQSMGKRVDRDFENFVGVHADFQSLEADFDAAAAKLSEDQAKVAQLSLDARDAMHEQMTKEEWEAVFAKLDKK